MTYTVAVWARSHLDVPQTSIHYRLHQVLVPREALALGSMYPPLLSLLPFRSEALLPSPGMKIVSEGDPESWACLEMVLRSV